MMTRRTAITSAAVLAGASSVFRGLARAAASPAERSGGVATGGLRPGMVGFMLAHEQFRVPELVELGVAAEEAGFDLLAASDHFQPWQANEGHSGEAWVTLAAIGQRTRRIWMGTTVTCPTFRYPPAVVAEAFASLSWLTPGRVFLGVGSGEALNEEAATGQWPNWAERSERLVEATAIIRELWSGREVRHTGRFYSVNARLFDPPPAPVPILMAGNSGKALRRCGQYADGLVTDPGTWQKHKAEFAAGAAEGGRSGEQMPVLVELFVSVGDAEEARQAATLWRFLPKAFKTYFNHRDPQAIQDRAAEEIPLEQVIAQWVVSPDPSVHIERINALFHSGATIVNIHSGQADQRKVIEFYGRKVLPAVAAGRAG